MKDNEDDTTKENYRPAKKQAKRAVTRAKNTEIGMRGWIHQKERRLYAELRREGKK